jgi:hypothetical protein
MDRPVPWWLRAYLYVAAFQGIVGMGVTGLFSHEHFFLPLTVSPLNANFIGALYLAGGVGVLLSGMSRSVPETRLFVIGFGVIATIATGVTFAYWGDFSADHTPWQWTTTYVLDASIAVLLFVILRFWRARRPGWHRLSPIFVAQAVVMGAFGVLLLLAPQTAIDIWPWKLTVILARLYGAFFLAYGVVAALAAWEAHLPALRAFVISSFLLMTLSMLAVLPHRARFTSEAAQLVWFGGFGLGALLLAVPLVTYWIVPRIGTLRRPVAKTGSS